MLTIYGKPQKFCDGVSRRSFLKIGGFALGSIGGITLADILAAQEESGKISLEYFNALSWLRSIRNGTSMEVEEKQLLREE